MSETGLEIVELSAIGSDEEFSSSLCGSIRRVHGEALLMTGGLDAPLRSGATGWMTAIENADVLPMVVADGPVGERGIALLLLADMAWIGPGAHIAGRVPRLPELAQIRLGPLAARRFAFACDPLDALVELGHCRRADDPAKAAAAFASSWTGGIAGRLRRGWRAARELAPDEAMTFSAWMGRIAGEIE
ncbi:hypothetical protein [Roseibium aggregatum]|uniref:Uncharacterized protein n=1 Tax=Roseibium aggregatum TaxID=187304 RepID=A0A939J4L4_9HYPH|nr:hypothetical protein [Roseibium aggregatum]MBN9670829.1 hypothetical protein [Roseibium aggregatum]